MAFIDRDGKCWIFGGILSSKAYKTLWKYNIDTLCVLDLTGISVLEEDELVNIYPNPTAVGKWIIVVGDNLLGGTAEVFDVNGRVVFTSVIGHRTSVISPDVPKGVYLLRISSSKSSSVRKLVRM